MRTRPEGRPRASVFLLYHTHTLSLSLSLSLSKLPLFPYGCVASALYRAHACEKHVGRRRCRTDGSASFLFLCYMYIRVCILKIKQAAAPQPFRFGVICGPVAALLSPIRRRMGTYLYIESHGETCADRRKLADGADPRCHGATVLDLLVAVDEGANLLVHLREPVLLHVLEVMVEVELLAVQLREAGAHRLEGLSDAAVVRQRKRRRRHADRRHGAKAHLETVRIPVDELELTLLEPPDVAAEVRDGSGAAHEEAATAGNARSRSDNLKEAVMRKL